MLEVTAPNKPRRVFIDHHDSGTGRGITNALSSHPGIEIIGPIARGTEEQRREAMAAADLTVLCAPPEKARMAVGLAAATGSRILDMSGAHRTACSWVYGLPDLSGEHRQLISRAHAVSNPDPRAMGACLLLRPLLSYGLLSASVMYSLAIPEPLNQSEYDVAREIIKWSRLAAAPVLSAVPETTLSPGLLCRLPLAPALLPVGVTTAILGEILLDRYRRAPLVSPYVSTNELAIGYRTDAGRDVSTTAAISNINIMLGMPEQLGLRVEESAAGSGALRGVESGAQPVME